jgi:hypothetical protein
MARWVYPSKEDSDYLRSYAEQHAGPWEMTDNGRCRSIVYDDKCLTILRECRSEDHPTDTHATFCNQNIKVSGA